jgi:hypothetical protein
MTVEVVTRNAARHFINPDPTCCVMEIPSQKSTKELDKEPDSLVSMLYVIDRHKYNEETGTVGRMTLNNMALGKKSASY